MAMSMVIILLMQERRAQPIVGGTSPRQVVLGYVREPEKCKPSRGFVTWVGKSEEPLPSQGASSQAVSSQQQKETRIATKEFVLILPPYTPTGLLARIPGCPIPTVVLSEDCLPF